MIVLYGTPTCPKCNVLSKKMESKNITFMKCMDLEKMEKLNILSVPILITEDGQKLAFMEANKWIDQISEEKYEF